MTASQRSTAPEVESSHAAKACSYAEFVRKMPNGVPDEVAELAAAGKAKMAILQLVKMTGITMPSAQVVVRFIDFRQGRG
jgi:hypothetical protein